MSAPNAGRRPGGDGGQPLLRTQGLRVIYPAREPGAGEAAAVDGVDLALREGERLCIVGESGSGKTSLLLALLGVAPGRVEGRVLYRGRDLARMEPGELRGFRGARIGLVPQEAGSALNPVLRVGDQMAEVQWVHGRPRREARERVAPLLHRVGLPPEAARRFPHELSGGMRQRALLALALAPEPEVLLADEPTSALDTTLQAGLLDLLRGLPSAQIIVTHDMSVAARMGGRVAVMYGGRIAEQGPAAEVLREPQHPYTQALIQCARPGPLAPIPGEPPDPARWPPGCRFHPRCPRAFEPCPRREPRLQRSGEQREVSCFLHHP